MTGATWANEGAAANSNKLEIQRIAAMILAGPSLQSAEWRTTVAAMERPIEVDLPHKLGREEARRRIAGNVHKLTDHIPGGAADVKGGGPGYVQLIGSRRLSSELGNLVEAVAAAIGAEPQCFGRDPHGRLSGSRLYLVRPDGFVAAAAKPLHAVDHFQRTMTALAVREPGR